jgi:DNA transformation protein and related proteins
VLNQLGALPELRARAMFGAHCLYAGNKSFGILDAGRLFFKTDAASAADYTARGMGTFTNKSKGRRLTMAYHEVPPDVLENAPELTSWARWAILLAAAKPKKAKNEEKIAIFQGLQFFWPDFHNNQKKFFNNSQMFSNKRRLLVVIWRLSFVNHRELVVSQ